MRIYNLFTENEKFLKKSLKKFARTKIMSTFAVPFETNGIFCGLEPRKIEFIDKIERID